MRFAAWYNTLFFGRHSARMNREESSVNKDREENTSLTV